MAKTTKNTAFEIVNGKAVRKDALGKNTTSSPFDPFHDQARGQIREDKEMIEAAKKRGVTFSDIELDDIKKLDARRARKDPITQQKKLSGEDTVILKQIEAQRAAQKFDSSKIQEEFSREQLAKKLGKSKNEITALDVFEAELAAGKRTAGSFISRAETAEMRANEAKNKALSAQREQAGQQIIKEIGSTEQQQRENLKKKGINLHGTLSPKAAAKLREQGLI